MIYKSLSKSLFAALALVATVAFTACNDDDPAEVGGTVSMDASSYAVPSNAAASAFTFNVTTSAPETSWLLSSGCNWLKFKTAEDLGLNADGTPKAYTAMPNIRAKGPQTVTIVVAANTSGKVRNAEVTMWVLGVKQTGTIQVSQPL